MIDDLITKDTNEQYRMFTSRAEYRILLRFSNAHKRLFEKSKKNSLIDRDLISRIKEILDSIESINYIESPQKWRLFSSKIMEKK
mgnify:CR=1 FL=1